MGSITQQQGGVAGTLAARNRALNTPAGQGAPSIADLVGGVGRNLATRDAALLAAPPATPQPAASAAPAAPAAGLGNLMQSIQQAQSTVAPALGAAPDIAALIRQVRQLQGF